MEKGFFENDDNAQSDGSLQALVEERIKAAKVLELNLSVLGKNQEQGIIESLRKFLETTYRASEQMHVGKVKTSLEKIVRKTAAAIQKAEYNLFHNS